MKFKLLLILLILIPSTLAIQYEHYSPEELKSLYNNNIDRVPGIVKSLIGKERCVCELEAILDKSQSTISHHLRKLERANLITGFKKGNYTYYHLNDEVLKLNMKLLTSILS